MSEATAQAPHFATALKVATVATDLKDAQALAALVASLGHIPVAQYDAADVVLVAAGSTPAQIDAALRAIAAALSVRVRAPASDAFAVSTERRNHPLLTPRELEILTAIGDGLSNKAIARHLAISQHTVKFHVESLFRKLEVRTRAEAVAKAVERRGDERIEL